MAQFLTLFSVLVLVAVFNPDILESSAFSVAPDSGEIDFSQLDRSLCLDEDFDPQVSPFCKNIRNYPATHSIDDLIESSGMAEFFEPFELPPANMELNNNSVKHYLCNTYTETITPQAGVNGELDWFVIINTDKFKQGIIIETCSSPGTETCGDKNGMTVPNHYKARCEQEYVYRTLLGYRKASIIQEAFKFPSCCKCVLITNGSNGSNV